MTEIVNLRRARKRKLKADKDSKAEENRAKFGRTREEKQRAAAEMDLKDRQLDQARLIRED